MRFICLTLIIVLFARISHADNVECTTSVGGKFITLNYDENEYILNDNSTLREVLFKGWGDLTCPSYVTLRHLTPSLNESERSMFCLQFDDNSKTYTGFVNGPRDAYLNCKIASKSFCEKVNDSKDAAIAITGIGAGAVGGASTVASAAGVTAVTHSSGAVILTGSSGYIAGTLATMGAGALSVLTAPVTITTAVVSVVAVGGAVYYCKE